VSAFGDKESDDDEEENFEDGQRTNRNDDMDFFSKLMRNKLDFSQ